MRWLPALSASGFVILMSACTPTEVRDPTLSESEPATNATAAVPSAPPIAAKIAHTVTSPNGDRVDPYYWMRDDDSKQKRPEVMAHLDAENAWRRAQMAHVADLESALFEEMKARIKEDDSSVPYFENGYWYYTRFETGKQYPIYARKERSLDAAEQILLDGNELAADASYFQIGGFEVSPDNRWLAYTEDRIGRRQYTLKYKELATGITTGGEITGIDPGLVYANDSKTLYFVKKDPQTLLGNRVFRIVTGAAAESAVEVYAEADPSYYMGIGKTTDDAYVVIFLSATEQTEMQVIDANQPSSAPRPLLARMDDHEYSADRLNDRWVIRSNWEARNFRLLEATDQTFADRTRWKELVAHSEQVAIEGFDLMRQHIAINERSNALLRIKLLDVRDGSSRYIDADDPAYAMRLSVNVDPDLPTLRYAYGSLTTPNSVFDVDLKTFERTLKKQEPVLGDFDAANYASERLWATARDGTKVPVSVVYRKSTPRDGSAPLYVYAYGSYGSSTDPYFSSTRLSLLDRGFVYAIAHVRGGEEMGRAWYDAGRLLSKMNTFTDFIDVTRFLKAERYGDPERVFAMGGSAGGLLIGAVANMAGAEYKALVAHVPFVDVVTTMLDESIPLTTNEYDEWGNPAEKPFYDYMLSYSPYDNVRAQAYPAMLVTTGLWDSQVQYFEPAKWVARLRELKTDNNALLFHINTEAGHGGRSGRFDRLKEVAMEYAFVLDQAGLAQAGGSAP